jgi:hypothetical protein
MVLKPTALADAGYFFDRAREIIDDAGASPRERARLTPQVPHHRRFAGPARADDQADVPRLAFEIDVERPFDPTLLLRRRVEHRRHLAGARRVADRPLDREFEPGHVTSGLQAMPSSSSRSMSAVWASSFSQVTTT